MTDDPDNPPLRPGAKLCSWRDRFLAKIAARRRIVELDALTDARCRSVEGGKTSAGTFSAGMGKAELSNWIVEHFGLPKWPA